jgi:hypothetical protein
MSTKLCGPDFLHSVANAERANGNDINADIYEERAREWQADLHELEQLRSSDADLRYRLAQIQIQAQAKAA